MPQLGPDQRSRNRRPRRRNQVSSRAPVSEYEEQQELEASRERNDLDVSDLRDMSVNELRAVSRDLQLETGTQERKDDLVDRILQRQTERAGHAYATGILDIVDEGFGFMRRHGLLPSPDDVYVSSSQVRRFGLRIGDRVSGNYPEILLMVALIGERPEEVTDMRRSVKGEVISSTFDEPTENHTHVAEMALEIAKRQVETGRDVVILLDSITRLARAYNLALPPSGRTLSGGIDPIALYPPKRFFGAARKIEEGGSLTIIGTCLVDTGSRMDDVIYEEFKGTGTS